MRKILAFSEWCPPLLAYPGLTLAYCLSAIALAPLNCLYQSLPAACHDYDPRAPEVAERVAAIIAYFLPDTLAEHIGSTSVPDCAGKGIIDLLLPYQDVAHLQAIKVALAKLGFQRQTTRDPFPEDRPMRTGSIAQNNTIFRLHLHIVPADSPEVADLRAFRDRLRADPALLAAYVARKREILATGTTDPIDYSIVKGEFVQKTLKEAPGFPSTL
jgi:GrpB-like predicted nucleotidyltransferase (UPF0157 family)